MAEKSRREWSKKKDFISIGLQLGYFTLRECAGHIAAEDFWEEAAWIFPGVPIPCKVAMAALVRNRVNLEFKDASKLM